jgi:hypothetical protein
MEDKQLDELLDDARHHYRVLPEPAVEAIWQRIDAEAFRAPGGIRHRGTDWRLALRVAAASLVIGVLAGRWTSGVGLGAAFTSEPGETATAMSSVSRPYQRTTETLLGQSAVLLAALSSDATSNSFSREMSDQAAQLLGTTRLLLDSPAGTEPGMRALLLDLELTLAQVARLQPARGDTELNLINDSVAERDIVPRIRSAVVDLAGGGY